MEEGFPGVAEYAEANFLPWRVIGYEINSGDCLMDEPCAQPEDVAKLMAKGIQDCRNGDGNYAVEFTPPSPGPYSAYLSSERVGMPSTFFGAIVAR